MNVAENDTTDAMRVAARWCASCLTKCVSGSPDATAARSSFRANGSTAAPSSAAVDSRRHPDRCRAEQEEEHRRERVRVRPQHPHRLPQDLQRVHRRQPHHPSSPSSPPRHPRRRHTTLSHFLDSPPPPPNATFLPGQIQRNGSSSTKPRRPMRGSRGRPPSWFQ